MLDTSLSKTALRRDQALADQLAELLKSSLDPKQHGGIKQIAHFPEPGTYMRQCVLGGHNADFVIRLFDGRLFPMECKASNSEVNGFKRLNKEVVVDAGDWYREFGQSSVVAAAALRGVFKTDNVAAAQAQRVHIFWWHKMDALASFLASTRAA